MSCTLGVSNIPTLTQRKHGYIIAAVCGEGREEIETCYSAAIIKRAKWVFSPRKLRPEDLKFHPIRALKLGEG